MPQPGELKLTADPAKLFWRDVKTATISSVLSAAICGVISYLVISAGSQLDEDQRAAIAGRLALHPDLISALENRITKRLDESEDRLANVVTEIENASGVRVDPKTGEVRIVGDIVVEGCLTSDQAVITQARFQEAFGHAGDAGVWFSTSGPRTTMAFGYGGPTNIDASLRWANSSAVWTVDGDQVVGTRAFVSGDLLESTIAQNRGALGPIENAIYDTPKMTSQQLTNQLNEKFANISASIRKSAKNN